MGYNFEDYVNRKATAAKKWEIMYMQNPNVDADVVPLSVADMEFRTAPEITDGLKEYFSQEDLVLGYNGATSEFYQAVIDWQLKRHKWSIKKEWIISTPGVVAAMYASVKALTEPGDGVIVFKPVYHPFSTAVTDNDRLEVNIPLLSIGEDYFIDYEAFEAAAAKAENKVLLFCSPHNPVGRVWTKEELEKLADICIRHQLYIVSDEIWNDLIMPGFEHTVLATVNPDLTPYLITCTAATKSFNLAGLMVSSIIIEDASLRAKFENEIIKSHQNVINVTGFEATRIAYTKAEAWLDQVIDIINQNQKLVKSFFEINIPAIKAYPIQGTYVQWIDCRALGMNNQALENFLHQTAQFFPNQGYIFGQEGSGFIRINLALPTDVLQTQLNRLLHAVNQLSIG